MGNNPHRRSGIVMLLIAWVLLFAGAYWFFELRLARDANPNRAEVLALQRGEVRLQRNRDGHYLAEGEINGHPVTFLVDTGATRVALSPGLAQKLALVRGTAVNVQTANGATRAYQTRLQSVRLGAIEVHDVGALITAGLDGGTVLLGMSFLQQLEFTQRGRELILKPLSQS